MDGQGDKANRRPLKSRTTGWAAIAARAALATGIGPNQVSFIGIVISLAGAVALYKSGQGSNWLFLIAAVAIQTRLLANMLDGMVAVEGGRGGPTGAIWNEFPDRIEDSLLLISAGYAASLPEIGWLAALLAAICAYVRLLGGTLHQPQDFGGPMAKPHRMAALTIGCLIAFLLSFSKTGNHKDILLTLQATLSVIAAGTFLTIALRLMRLSKAVRA
jgi:phosphatidylglycerophosphate synthase